MCFIIFILTLIQAQIITNDFNSPFTSAKNSYRIKAKPSSNIFKNDNELFDRNKCQTCCRSIIVSDFNFHTNQLFTPEDKHQRFVMDMEFDDISGIRNTESNFEQTILLRPLNKNNILQLFEFYSYKMINLFFIPHRVHDIRGGIKIGNRLIIWKKKEPLAISTNNQRFVYIHPYNKKYYNSMNQIYTNFQKHFYLPFYTTENVCYEAVINEYQRWSGNKHLTVLGNHYQIRINKCSDDPKQIFTIINI